MRTTLTIEDKLAQSLKELAHKSGKSFKQVVNETLKSGLKANGAGREPKTYRLKPVSLGEMRTGVNLDRALHVAEQLEDEELVRKLRMRK